MNWNRLTSITLCFFVGFFLLSYTGYSQNAIDSIMELGDDLVDMDDYEAAEDKYDQALEIDENYVPALKAKVRVLLLRDKYNKAKRLAENSLEEHGDQPAFYLYLGEASIDKERYEQAMDYLKDALELVDEKNTELLNRIYVKLGAAYQKLENYEDALENYSKALDIEQTNPSVFLYRGNIYYKREDYENALADFKKVLELDPSNHLAQYNLGMCYFRQGDKTNACDAFHNACENGNKNACRMVVSKCLRDSE
ncbi:MAG: tetratricopeptide repeat protein [Bacteroidota bacterium]